MRTQKKAVHSGRRTGTLCADGMQDAAVIFLPLAGISGEEAKVSPALPGIADSAVIGVLVMAMVRAKVTVWLSKLSKPVRDLTRYRQTKSI